MLRVSIISREEQPEEQNILAGTAPGDTEGKSGTGAQPGGTIKLFQKEMPGSICLASRGILQPLR